MKQVTKIHLELSEILLEKIDKAIIEDGFHSRSEFIRFLIMNYTPRNEKSDFVAQKNEEEDEYANVDLEFGIPPEIVKKLEEEARRIVGKTD